MKIRHSEINTHLTSSPSFEDFMAEMVKLYASCPDASKIRFIQAIEDQFKAAAPARGRASTGKSGGGSGWRNEQKAHFAGRGAKWVKVKGPLMKMVMVQLGIFEKDGDDVEDYRSWVTKAGFAWIRYSGPRGSEDAQELAFEVRIGGSRIDHPKHLVRFTAQMWNQLEENRVVLGGTPFGLNLEN